jgi:hypothetical protein
MRRHPLRSIYTSSSYYKPWLLRGFSKMTTQIDGVVIGMYEGGELTETAKRLNRALDGSLHKLLPLCKAEGKEAEVHLLYGLKEDLPRLAVVGLGKASNLETEQREASRKAVSAFFLPFSFSFSLSICPHRNMIQN